VFVQTWSKTDVGKQRSINEDSCYVDPEGELVLVLDGMGGHKAGEVASQVAMETISAFYKHHSRDQDSGASMIENYDPTFTYQTNLLRQAVVNANKMVLEESRRRDDHLGMGSTVAGVALHGYTISVMNVGDSRLYLLRDGSIEQISRDHTLAQDQLERGILTVEEARESQLRHVLSSVIGVDDRVRMHLDELPIFPGDVFLLCTDGLNAVMEDQEILVWLRQDSPGPEILTRLIDEVNARGGPDNITLALIAVSEGEGESKDSAIASFISKAMGDPQD
jgi:PPM family protein phosphatase